MSQDYYEILGVPKDASEADIKKAFRLIARECHPDRAGDDPHKAEQFKEARKAYETLVDPVTRSRYDKRGQRRGFGKGSFFDAFYRATASETGAPPRDQGPPKRAPSGWGAHDAGGTARDPGPRKPKGKAAPGNDLNLDDLFNGFGQDFSAGAKKPPPTPPPRSPGASTSSTDALPQPGDDVYIDLEVPAEVAREGGTVPATYQRMQREDRWRPGMPGPGVASFEDIADVRIIPGTRDGETLREKGLGDAGPYGGTYGDLVVRVRLRVEPRRTHARPGTGPEREPPPSWRDAGVDREDRGPQPPPPSEAASTEKIIDISIVEAILGGRIEIDTPAGRLRMSIPPGTSSGAKMRLKGKGEGGGDLYVVMRIVVPRELDDESRKLIEEFARLNPGSPREL